MPFALVQTSGDTIAPIDNFGTAQTINTWTGATNFVVGNLVVVKVTHYSGASSNTLSCTVNGTAATKLERQNPTNVENASIIFYAVVATGGSRNVVLTPSAGTDHYVTLDVEEFSFGGTLSLVGGAATGADGSSTSPTANTDSGAASGDLAVGTVCVAAGGTRTITNTAPASPTLGFNEGDSGSHQGGAGASKILSAGGAQAFSWTFSVTAAWSVQTATFNQTGGAAAAVGQATPPPVKTYSFGSQRFRGPPQPTLGRGILQPSANPQVGFTGTGDAAVSPFAATAAGLLTFTSSGSAAISPFAADGTASGPFVAISAPWAQPQPMARGWGRPSRLPAPPIPRLGQGILRVDPFSGYQSSGAAALSSFAASAAGLLTFTSSGSAAFSQFASTSSGLETFTGSGSAARSPFACSVAGLETFTGTCSAAASPFAASGSGAVGAVFTSSGSAAVSPFAASASGTETFTGTASAALSPFAATGAASEAFAGTASCAASPFAVAGSAATGTVFTSSGSAAVAPFAASGSAAETFTGTASAARSPFAATGSGSELFTCSGSAALSPFACSGSGAQGTVYTSSGSAALSSFAAAGSGAEAFTGVATVACTTFAVTSSGSLAFLGTGSAAAQPFAVSGVGMVGGFIGVATVAVSPFAATATGLAPLAYYFVSVTTFAPRATPAATIFTVRTVPTSRFS